MDSVDAQRRVLYAMESLIHELDKTRDPHFDFLFRVLEITSEELRNFLKSPPKEKVKDA